MTLLGPGDAFPPITVALSGDETLDLPDHLSGHYGVVLLYRGSWCPYCNAQLRGTCSSASTPAAPSDGSSPTTSSERSAISTHLLATTPSAHLLEHLDLAGAILRAPVKIRDGHAAVPESPGTGVAWDEDAVAHFELAP